MEALLALGNRLAEPLIWPRATGEDRHRRLYFLGLVALFTPVALAVAWDDWQGGRVREVVYIGVLVVPLLLSTLAVRFAEDIRWGYRVLSGTSILGMGLLLTLGAGEGYGFIFFFFFPAGVCYALGAGEGGLWFLLSLLVLGGLLGADAGVSYPAAMEIRFLTAYGVVGILAMALQRSRDRLLGELAAEKAELERALAEVRTLSAMLPMCAWCGKVRDDEGYWSRIEEYLDSAAGTRVSHGICPECRGNMERG